MTPQPPPAIDIDQLRELANAATAAPWCEHPNGTSAWRGPDWDTVNNSVGQQYRHVCNATSVDAAGIADIELIVAMRNSFEAMLQELAELRAMKLAVHELAADRLANEGPGGDLAFEIERLTR
jgi:hypothetical protein